MAKGKVKIHSENILPIIKKSLYSDVDIFLRELVSNSCDALHKLKVLREQGEVDVQDDQFKIEVVIDKDKKTLCIKDTGIGMTAEEIEKYIAQIAFSGAEEFVKKYSTQNEKDQIIGHFGLGFYSAFMVSSTVEIDSLSYQAGAKAALWKCDEGSSEYDLQEGKKSSRGTEITLHINEDNQEFLEEPRIREILKKYCSFLPYPLYLNDQRINDKEPLWLKNPSELTEKDYKEFYRYLYPMESEPIFWVHLNVDYPFHLKGILYFPKISKNMDLTKSNIQLYYSRVFVSDNCKDLIPDYLVILKGAIDSPDIPVNVSRSYLQMDRTVRQLSTHISKKIADKLSSLYSADRDTFIKYWPDIEMIIKLGAIQDEKFYDKVKHFLLWKNLRNEWTTIEEYLERNQSKQEKTIFYSYDDKLNNPFLELYKEKGIEVIFANSYLDTSLISTLEGKISGIKFQRIDGAVNDLILDKDRENTLLDSEGKTMSAKIADFFRKIIGSEDLEVEAKSVASDTLPAFVVIDEQTRRIRDYLTISQQELPPGFMNKKTFVVNTNNKLIQAVYKLKDSDPGLAKSMIEQIYELSLLSQKELDPQKLTSFVERSNAVLEKLAGHITKTPK
ncbi:MAG: molecular chaperone HtpG [Simkaniaceae bacterium]